jgi:hypothetical protein
MINTLNLELTEQELFSVLYALQDRVTVLQGRLKDTDRVDIHTMLQRQYSETLNALSQAETLIDRINND